MSIEPGENDPAFDQKKTVFMLPFVQQTRRTRRGQIAHSIKLVKMGGVSFPTHWLEYNSSPMY